MTTYTCRVAEHESDPILSIEQARQLTHLDLVSGREIGPDDQHSYQQMEELSESKSHRSAREEGINFFCSVGYRIFPEGIGVRGTYTLADFLAVRGNRTVFVEVLSDTNVNPETLQKKAQLQQHGELCFILFSGTKESNDPCLVAAKRLIETWSDVLYCRLNGYTGNRIEQSHKVSVIYDTTRHGGIKLALSFARPGRMVVVSVKLATPFYGNSTAMPRAFPAYPTGSISYRQERIFLEIFQEFGRRTNGAIRTTSRHPLDTAIRAMRRKSGLKMTASDKRVMASLKSEYCGTPVEEEFMWTYHPPSRDLPPDGIFGSFALERTGPHGLDSLVESMKACGFVPEYAAEEYGQSVQHLTKQRPAYIQPIKCGARLDR